MIREREMKRGRLHGAKRVTAKESNKSGTVEQDLEQSENDENQSNANGTPTVVTDKSGEQESKKKNNNTKLKQGSNGNNNIVRDAIAKFIYNDLISDTYLHGSPQSINRSSHHYHPSLRSLNSSSNLIREYAEHRIDKIMAACHVLHRLLFLDKTSSLVGRRWL